MKLDRVLRPLVELMLKGMYFSWYREKKGGKYYDFFLWCYDRPMELDFRNRSLNIFIRSKTGILARRQ